LLRSKLPKIEPHVKLFFEKFRASVCVQQVFRGIATGKDLEPHGITLKGCAELRDSLAMRMIQRLGDS
jgi:hypothetical protein